MSDTYLQCGERKHYNYFRDYDPGIGRFVESDPSGLGGGLNTYGYVRGAPLRLVDRDGLQAFAPPAPPFPIPGMYNPVGDANANIARGFSAMLSDGGAVTYDNAGQKVSPRAQCLPSPGDCGEGEHRRMQDQVDSSCGQQRSCRPGMTQIELIINRDKNRQCAAARDRINKTCFAGGDKGHRDAANDAWSAVANCDGMMR